MKELHDLAKELRASAKALEAAARKDIHTLHARRDVSAAIDRGRGALRLLDGIGFDSDDFERETELWKRARTVADGRRILTNRLSIAAQSMFTAADPKAMQRDLERAVKGLLSHADAEQELIGAATTARVA